MTARLLILTGILGLHSLTGCTSPDESSKRNDPAGDLAKLQGRWKRIPQGEGPTKWPESYLIIDGNQLTYDHTELRTKGLEATGARNQKAATEKWGVERYRFVLDSGSEPKKMRFTHMWKDGREIELPRDHPEWNKRYTVENGILRIWTMWAERHEQPIYEYERVSATSE